MLAVRSAVGELGENATGWTGRLYQRMIRYGLHKSPTVVCVSEATRKDLARLVNSSSQSLEVVHNGLNYPYSPMDKSDAMSQLKALGIEEGSQYLLHVGGNHWYKNRMGVLRIFRELIRLQDMQDIQLVLAGEPGTAEMNSYITVNGLDARVTVLTGVDNEQLRALYSSARGLLFPSLYEGFGWPIIEAQACGCPVFTTNRPPMTEVGGSSAIYIDPQNYPDAAGRIATALLLGEGGGQAALDNAARFGAGAMVDGYISIYRRIADKS
jgi:glycosyltransferase involved in cell wall biosynthesis